MIVDAMPTEYGREFDSSVVHIIKPGTGNIAYCGKRLIDIILPMDVFGNPRCTRCKAFKLSETL